MEEKLYARMQKIEKLIIGMEISIDVSTCEEDAGHRVFARVEGLQEVGPDEMIVLATEYSRNFK